MREKRHDEQGSIHHCGNRGVGERLIFQDVEDMRYFLSRLARSVRRGEVEVLAYCLLLNHFHLLLRSPCGKLSEAMRRIQNEHVRRFNRKYGRDGPLFRGRFWNQVVRTEEHFWTVVRYIDLNAVEARLAVDASDYPFGSARFYRRGDGPLWLHRDLIESSLRHATGSSLYLPRSYDRLLGRRLMEQEVEIVERRLTGPKAGEDALDRLIGASAEGVRVWMLEKARNADGTWFPHPVAAAGSVLAAVAEMELRVGRWTLAPGHRGRDAWVLVRVGLLGDSCALHHREIAGRTGVSPSTVGRAMLLHRRLLLEDPQYSARAAEVLRRAIELSRVDKPRTGRLFGGG